MKKVKIFIGSDEVRLEKRVNAWLKAQAINYTEGFQVISLQQSSAMTDSSHFITITVFYDDGEDEREG